MSSTLLQAQICRRVVHAIQQGVTGRAENPNLLQGCIRSRAPSAVSAVVRSMRNVHNSIFAARLAGSRRIGMAGVESLQVPVWTALRPVLVVVFAILARIAHVKLGPGFTGALYPAFRRAVPSVALAAAVREELHPALSTVPSSVQKFSWLPVIAILLLTVKRTEFVPGIGRCELCTALPAMLHACHV